MEKTMGKTMEKTRNFYENAKEQVATQLEKVNLDSVLGTIGLQVAKRGRGASLPIVAAFGAGMAVGAGAALLLTPMSGSDLRAKIGELLKKVPFIGGDKVTELAASPDVPVDDAAESKAATAKSANSDKSSKRTQSDVATA